MATMPQDWDDHAGWERYHAAAIRGAERRVGSLMFDAPGMRFLDALQRGGCKRVWFPGCGCSLAPAIYAAFGFDVVATDVAPSAVAWQTRRAALSADELLTDASWRERLAEAAPRPGGALHAAVHDFRDAYAGAPFDCIVNERAFQGLPAPSRVAAARSHFAALAPGRQAIFDTMNVQGAGRDAIELALEEAGFWVPLRRTEAWYRDALAQTGIPFVFILGQPRVPATGAYTRDATRKQAETELAKYRAEYERRANEEWEQTRGRANDGVTKIATVVYSTG